MAKLVEVGMHCCECFTICWQFMKPIDLANALAKAHMLPPYLMRFLICSSFLSTATKG